MADTGFKARISDWTPQTLVVDHRAVTAGAGEFHGSPGDAGYEMLHPGGPKGDLITNGNREDKNDPLTYYQVAIDDTDDPDQADADEELFSVYSSDGWSDPVSGYLRTGESDPDELYSDAEMDEMIASMDRIGERNVLAEPVSVYRVAPASHYDVEEGDKVVDPAFLSTTVFKQITDQYRTGEDDVTVRIDLPAGAHILPHRHMNPSGSAKGEVILPRGMPLELKGREDGVLVYAPVMTDKGADRIEQDDTSSVLDEAPASTAATLLPDTEIGDPAVTTETLGKSGKGEPNPGTKKDKRLKDNKYEVTGPEPSEIGGENTAPWRGPITVEGIETGDGRQFDSGSLTWADMPLPLRWNKEDSHGGEPRTLAVNVGRIDKVWREDSGLIMGEGLLDLGNDDGKEVHRKISGGYLRGISVDVDSVKDADMELVWPVADPDGENEPDPFAQMFAAPEKVVFHKGRIRAATLVDIPAFAEAYVALLGEDGAVVAGGEPIGALRQVHTVRTHTTGVEAPARPPADWFANPDLSVPTGITVTPDGRVYGHAALWGTCHIGQAGMCVTPPREDAHPYFMTGNVWTEGGDSASVGQITVGTGHAALSLGHRAASDHYDNTGSAVADVAVGNDAHGIWVAGAIRPGASPERIHELRAAGQVSGDWRRIGGQLRLVGLLAVNVPGFPVPKLRTSYASGQQLALVAAGVPQLTEALSEDDLDQWAYDRIMHKLSARVHGGE